MVFKNTLFLSLSYGVLILSVFLTVLFFVIFIILRKKRDKISTFEIENMSKEAYILSKKIKALFSDKYIIDVLKFSNLTRFGYEIPNIEVYVEDDFISGFVAIENICNFDKMDRDKYEQNLSGVFSREFKKYAVVSSYLSGGDVYMIFNFEDKHTSYRFFIDEKAIKNFINDNPHYITLSRDLTWHSDETPHMSVIARTRAGKSVFCGKYMAALMTYQGWIVEYNSAKNDVYVKKFNGKSNAVEIVERGEYWIEVMNKRLDEINFKGKETYLQLSDMRDICVFFDEIGNLNAELENDKKLKTRWENAINKLTATGGSAGIHVIAISQFATKESFLPSLARVNCSDAVIMLGSAADSADERRYLIPGFTDIPKRNYLKGQGLARLVTSGKKWETPHFFETPFFTDYEKK